MPTANDRTSTGELGGPGIILSVSSASRTPNNGTNANDTINASASGADQVHVYGKNGDDTFNLDMTNTVGRQGIHAYGGEGADTFIFSNVENSDTYSVSRINDFEISRDTIHIEGFNGQLTHIDLNNLPNQNIRLADGSYVGVSIVQYTSTYHPSQGPSESSSDSLGLGAQQFLQIGDYVFIALDGSRNGGLEWHFPTIPVDTESPDFDQEDTTALDNPRIQLEEVPYHGEVNFVPYDAYSSVDIPIYFWDDHYFHSAPNGEDFFGSGSAEYVRGHRDEFGVNAIDLLPIESANLG